MVTPSSCDLCNKSSLSLLLLRPSPVPRNQALVQSGAQSIVAEAASVAGLLPTRLPTESRFALRLLRAGYVHVYIPEPPPGVRSWLTFRVTPESELVPQRHAKFSDVKSSLACKIPEHNASGARLLAIPQAHKIPEIWIAYSPNLWDETLRSRNKANPEAMQKFSLHRDSPNAFKPTQESLKAQVLECALPRLSDSPSDQHYGFNSQVGKLADLLSNLKQAAEKHPKTCGKEMAFVLNDPIGIAAELNALRIRRNILSEEEIRKPENFHPLNSSNLILGIRKSVVDAADSTSLADVTPLMTVQEFQQKQLPSEVYSLEVTEEDRRALLRGAKPFMSPMRRKQLSENRPMVWVVYPNSEERAQEWTVRTAAKNWSKYERYYDDEARIKWLSDFDAKMNKEHYDQLQRMEEDWFASVEDQKTLACFRLHFNPESTYSPANPPVESVIYASESNSIHIPAPYSTGSMMSRYLALINKPITDDAAILLRSLVGNRKSIIGIVHHQLTADPGDGMRDKTFDILKGFSELAGFRSAMPSHGWIGHALAFFSMGQLSAFTAAAVSWSATKVASQPATTAAIAKLQTLMVVQRALEIATQGAIQGDAPKLPVMIKLQVSADEALDILAARSSSQVGFTKNRIKKLRKAGQMVTLTLLTDTDAIKAVNGNLKEAAKDASSGTVRMGRKAVDAAVAVVAGKTVVLSKDAFLNLYHGQAKLAGETANLLRKALPAIQTSSLGSDFLQLGKTLDARLAMASMIVQTYGIVHNIEMLKSADTPSARLDATYGLLDSAVGLTAGALQIGVLYGEIRTSRLTPGSAGEVAIKKSLTLAALRLAGSAAGVAGGLINYASSLKKFRENKAAANTSVSTLYYLSAGASMGVAVTSVITGIGLTAETLAARGLGGVAARTIAARLGTHAVIGTVAGVGMTVSGVGLVLLGAGVVFQVGAIALTPDDLQVWIGRSYFGTDGGYIFTGKRDDKFKSGDWLSEKTAFDDLLTAQRKAQ